MHNDAADSAYSLSPFGERAGVRGLPNSPSIEPLTPPLSLRLSGGLVSVTKGGVRPPEDSVKLDVDEVDAERHSELEYGVVGPLPPPLPLR